MKYLIYAAKRLVLFLLLTAPFMALADVTLDPTVRDNVRLVWTHPTEYVDNSPLPPENILRTIIERSSDGVSWTQLQNEPAYPTDFYLDPTAPLGEGAFSYRVSTVIIGNLISNPSNVSVATLFTPKPSAAPVLRLE